jgi:hypothetical protein
MPADRGHPTSGTKAMPTVLNPLDLTSARIGALLNTASGRTGSLLSSVHVTKRRDPSCNYGARYLPRLLQATACVRGRFSSQMRVPQ